jgi:hypothetical protein
MRTYECKLASVTPVAFGRFFSEEVPKGPKENHDAYEKRTWMNRAHTTKEGNVFIPPLAFKNALTAIAKYLGEQIPGKGKSTYTKHFASGVLVTDPLILPVKKDDLKGQWIHVPADGVRGGSKRVLKCFPVIEEWSGSLLVTVLDETITEEVLKRHLIEAGNFIGVGSLRVQNNGIYGRFKVVDMKQVSA